MLLNLFSTDEESMVSSRTSDCWRALLAGTAFIGYCRCRVILWAVILGHRGPIDISSIRTFFEGLDYCFIMARPGSQRHDYKADATILWHCNSYGPVHPPVPAQINHIIGMCLFTGDIDRGCPVRERVSQLSHEALRPSLT